MLLKVLLVLKTGNFQFSDWIGSHVACNAPVSRVGGGRRVVRGFQMTGA